MNNQEIWDRLWNILSMEDQAVVSNMLTAYKPVEQLTTDTGSDLINFYAFVKASDQFRGAISYRLKGPYIGEILMGVTILCDYYSIGPLVAVRVWETGTAVPIFRRNMPYAIRTQDTDLIIGDQYSESEASRSFF